MLDGVSVYNRYQPILKFSHLNLILNLNSVPGRKKWYRNISNRNVSFMVTKSAQLILTVNNWANKEE